MSPHKLQRPGEATSGLLNYCQGCGKEFPTFWALLAHEKECEA